MYGWKPFSRDTIAATSVFCASGGGSAEPVACGVAALGFVVVLAALLTYLQVPLQTWRRRPCRKAPQPEKLPGNEDRGRHLLTVFGHVVQANPFPLDHV